MSQDEVTMHDGQIQTLTDLVFDHGDYVRAVVRRLGVAEADVADVSQEVWVVVIRRLHAFEGRSAMRTWLYGICRRVCRDHFRRAHRRYERVREVVPEPVAQPEQHRAIEARQRLLLLRAASAELSADRLDVLDAIAHGHESVGALAERHRCADKTIFSRLYATRAYLRRALRRAGYGLTLALVLPRRAAAMARLVGPPLPGGMLAAFVVASCALALLPPPQARGLVAVHSPALQSVRLVPYTSLPAATTPTSAPTSAQGDTPPPRGPRAASPPVDGATATGSSMEFTVLEVMEPTARMRLRQVAFMEFVPLY